MMKIRVREAIVVSILESCFPLLCKLGNNLIVNKYLLSAFLKKIFFDFSGSLGLTWGTQAPRSLLWNIESISLSRDWTQAHCIENVESYPLDHEKSPIERLFMLIISECSPHIN